MRYISKESGPPEEYVVWLQAHKDTLDKMIASGRSGAEIYDVLYQRTDIKNSVKKRLLVDQGFICCYCGQRIENDVHTRIEHVLPKKERPNLAVDFNNLLASCQGGSKIKIHVCIEGDTLAGIAQYYGVDIEHLEDVYVNLEQRDFIKRFYDLENLQVDDRVFIVNLLEGNKQHCDIRKGKDSIDITPLQEDCATKFRFGGKGDVLVSDENKNTVAILGLNDNRYLNRLREKKVEVAAEYIRLLVENNSDDKNALLEARAKILENLEATDQDGYLETFVFVITSGLL